MFTGLHIERKEVDVRGPTLFFPSSLPLSSFRATANFFHRRAALRIVNFWRHCAHASIFWVGRSGETGHLVQAEVHREGVPPPPLQVAVVETTALVVVQSGISTTAGPSMSSTYGNPAAAAAAAGLTATIVIAGLAGMAPVNKGVATRG